MALSKPNMWYIAYVSREWVNFVMSVMFYGEIKNSVIALHIRFYSYMVNIYYMYTRVPFYNAVVNFQKFIVIQPERPRSACAN